MLSHNLVAAVNFCDSVFYGLENDAPADELDVCRVARHSNAKKQHATAASASVAAVQKLTGSWDAGMPAVPT